MARFDKAKVVAAFRAAKEAAFRAMAENSADGGTCNLDSPAIKAPGVRAASLHAAAKEAGVELFEFKWYGRRWFWVNGCTRGMANLRNRMTEAAVHALHDNLPEGITASGYYAMD